MEILECVPYPRVFRLRVGAVSRSCAFLWLAPGASTLLRLKRKQKEISVSLFFFRAQVTTPGTVEDVRDVAEVCQVLCCPRGAEGREIVEADWHQSF